MCLIFGVILMPLIKTARIAFKPAQLFCYRGVSHTLPPDPGGVCHPTALPRDQHGTGVALWACRRIRQTLSSTTRFVDCFSYHVGICAAS